MKKVLFSALIAVIVLGISNVVSAKPKTTTTTTTSPGSFSAGPFGCWGSGTCTTTTTTTTGMIVNNDDGTVTVHWRIGSLTPENQIYYETREVFENPQAGGKIPDIECTALGLPIGTEFQVGAFPILKTADELIITIPVL